MRRIAIAFTGPSNSGKTTLVAKVSNILQDRGFKVAIVKHDPKDKAMFDREGKDSFKFFQTGADVAVVSPTRTTYFKQKNSDINELVDMFGDFDFLLVEGLKTLPLPRIAIIREYIDNRYFEVSDAVAIDDSIDSNQIPKECKILDLNNPEMIIDWIEKNGKRV